MTVSHPTRRSGDDPTLSVGCPVRDRAWAIPSWFAHVGVAVDVAGLDRNDVTAVFVGDPGADEDTFRAVHESSRAESITVTVIERRGTGGSYVRDWRLSRYEQMAELRNDLLDVVCDLKPDLFWSLDSDILVAPDTLRSAIDALASYDAVGSRCYLSPTGSSHPNHADLSRSGRLVREDSDTVSPVDVIMAAKLMTPKAYQVRYVAHRLGEDIGWSIQARAAGCLLGWDGRTVSKHVFRPDLIHEVDPRVGY